MAVFARPTGHSKGFQSVFENLCSQQWNWRSREIAFSEIIENRFDWNWKPKFGLLPVSRYEVADQAQFLQSSVVM